jgi:hypothetical protein
MPGVNVGFAAAVGFRAVTVAATTVAMSGVAVGSAVWLAPQAVSTRIKMRKMDFRMIM